ncbi:hypothetical protein B0H12DRAFT_1118300 [Mycena haematopus]|nr:hypothetical protein B0H12DRAFT_1118300 [Mycena haematopus]
MSRIRKSVTKEQLSVVMIRGRLADGPNDTKGSTRRQTSETLIHASAMDLVIFCSKLMRDIATEQRPNEDTSLSI